MRLCCACTGACAPQEIDQLCQEWKPEPLVLELPEEEKVHSRLITRCGPASDMIVDAVCGCGCRCGFVVVWVWVCGYVCGCVDVVGGCECIGWEGGGVDAWIWGCMGVVGVVGMHARAQIICFGAGMHEGMVSNS